MNIKVYYILQNAIHYFNLEDEAENIELDDDYLKDYDELSTFYRLFINNLSVILQFAVTEKDEFEELNKPSKEYDIEDNTIVVNPQNNELDFENLTHQLVLAIKRSKKNK